MRVIVIGGGKVGQTIIRHLSTEGHDVAVIDTDSSVITDITDNYDATEPATRSRRKPALKTRIL